MRSKSARFSSTLSHDAGNSNRRSGVDQHGGEGRNVGAKEAFFRTRSALQELGELRRGDEKRLDLARLEPRDGRGDHAHTRVTHDPGELPAGDEPLCGELRITRVRAAELSVDTLERNESLLRKREELRLEGDTNRRADLEAAAEQSRSELGEVRAERLHLRARDGPVRARKLARALY
jgi:hypothetical protein